MDTTQCNALYYCELGDKIQYISHIMQRYESIIIRHIKVTLDNKINDIIGINSILIYQFDVF